MASSLPAAGAEAALRLCSWPNGPSPGVSRQPGEVPAWPWGGGGRCRGACGGEAWWVEGRDPLCEGCQAAPCVTPLGHLVGRHSGQRAAVERGLSV